MNDYLDCEDSDSANEARICDQCGEDFFLDCDGIAYHGVPGDIDHDMDADHVAYGNEGLT